MAATAPPVINGYRKDGMHHEWKASVTTSFPGTPEEHTLYISRAGNEYLVTVEPEFRYCGSQVWDGYYPRRYKTVAGAKGGATKFLGPLDWEKI